ncbi:MAG: lysylphosphatidylglycerol synthase transmembrane domain-containing protein [Acidimicrobiales bacterium]
MTKDNRRGRRKMSWPRSARWLIHHVRGAVILMLLALVVEYLVLPLIPGIRASLHSISHVNIWLLAAGVVLEIGSLAAYVQLTHEMLPPPSLKRTYLARVDLSTLALSHVVPGGNAGSAALGYRLLTSEGVTPASAAFALGMQGVGSALVLNAIFWLALVVSIPINGYQPLYGIAAGAGVVMIALFASVVLLLTKGQRQLLDSVGSVCDHIPFVHGDKVTSILQEIATRLQLLAEDRSLLKRAIIWAAANWILDAASLWVFIAAFGAVVSPVDLLVAYGLANVLAVIPVTPGGLGIIEGILIPTLHGFGVAKTTAILAVLGYRMINFWLPIPVGGATYLSLKVRTEGWQKGRFEPKRYLNGRQNGTAAPHEKDDFHKGSGDQAT